MKARDAASTGASEEVTALIGTLIDAGQRLEDLTHGKVDTVTDGNGRTFTLHHAQEQLRDSQAVAIMERQHAQDAMQVLSQQIEQRERILSATLSAMSDFAYIFDRDGRFLFVNQPPAERRCRTCTVRRSLPAAGEG